jgi:hypothetical protein
MNRLVSIASVLASKSILIAVVLASAAAAALGACGDDDGEPSAGVDTGGGVGRTAPRDGAPAVAKRAEQVTEAAASPVADRAADLLRGDRLAAGVEVDAASEEGAVAATVDALYDGFADGAEKQFCDHVSREAKRQMAKEVGDNTGPDVVCQQTFDPLVLRAGKTKKLNPTLRAEITGIAVDGQRAVAEVDFDGKPGSLPLVREDGEWKLAAAPKGR